ncbi:hypothetical protein [Undibacterium sp.]|uniref:hypothetical protein n=1 Tax=Undibacterium sp. TaxID=1914977 RepID=UPI0037513904
MEKRRLAHEARSDKFRALNESESQGVVADSREVRIALLAKVKSGEITLEESQKQLKAIQRNAKKNGLVTRTQAFARG